MSLFNFLPGDTILMPTPPGMVKHLWILCFILKDGTGGIFVNLTDYENTEDNTIILNPGDHPFVIKKTAVLYSKAMVFKRQNLEKLLEKDVIFPHFPIQKDLLEKVQKGFSDSPRTPETIKRLIE